jgi:hypothetical protein
MQGKKFSNETINKEVQIKLKKALEKRKQRDRIGILIKECKDPLELRYDIDREIHVRRFTTKECSDHNRKQMLKDFALTISKVEEIKNRMPHNTLANDDE